MLAIQRRESAIMYSGGLYSGDLVSKHSTGVGQENYSFLAPATHYYLVCDMNHEAIWRRIKVIPF
jgi:hypothetical protein